MGLWGLHPENNLERESVLLIKYVHLATGLFIPCAGAQRQEGKSKTLQSIGPGEGTLFAKV